MLFQVQHLLSVQLDVYSPAVIIIFMDGQLEALFEELNSEADFRRLFFTTKRPEDNSIEYKKKWPADSGDLSDSDKKYLSKSISAFSNATGGLLLWGVSTRRSKSDRGREYANGLVKITNVEVVAEQMRSMLLSTVMPVNNGVRVQAVANRQGNGFIKVLIPPGNNPPHRALHADREYWVRLDGRTDRLEDFQIRDLMTRRGRPNLILQGTVKHLAPADGQFSPVVEVTVAIINIGQVVAKHVGWIANTPFAKVHFATDGAVDNSSLNSGRGTVSFSMQNGAVIHPNGLRYVVGRFQMHSIAGTDFIIPLSWYAEDADLRSGQIIIASNDPDTETVFQLQ